MSELLEEFQSLLNRLPTSGTASGAEVLFAVMEPEKADQLRLCAIPHEFNPDVLNALVPGMKREQAEKTCLEFSALSIVSATNGELSIHSTARSEVFAQWLQPDRRSVFVNASSQLARYFDTDNLFPLEERLHRSMFHLLGADPLRGFAEFEKLCRAARRESRWSACASLIKLVHEYDAVLSPELAAWLTYHEAKLASDLLDFERAEQLFGHIVEDQTAGAELLAKVLLRRGFIFCERREFAHAIEAYNAALRIAESLAGTSVKIYHVLSSLGEAYRDDGKLPRAEELLRQSLAGAESAGDLSAMANATNALGTLYFRRREAGDAAIQFKKTLTFLEQLGDHFRAAQAYNNLGMVYAELGDLATADQYYLQSLEIKREAGDTRGQATTLLNRVGILRRRNDLPNAEETNLQASSLFAEIRDIYGQAEAAQTLGRTYVAMNNPEAAREAFGRAVGLFDSCKASEKAEDARQQIELLGRKVGLPWWAWLILLGSLGFFLLFCAVMIYSVSNS